MKDTLELVLPLFDSAYISEETNPLVVLLKIEDNIERYEEDFYQSTMRRYSMLPEIYIAELGYQLAKYKCRRDFFPTLYDMQRGAAILLPGFHLEFAETTLDRDKNIVYPTGKQGLSPEFFAIVEKKVDLALGLFESFDPEIMAEIAPLIFNERDHSTNPDMIFIPNFTGELSIPEGLEAWVADKVAYFASRGIYVATRNGYPDRFSHYTAFVPHDVKTFLECELIAKAELGDNAEAPEIDHAEPTKSSWDIRKIMSHTDTLAFDSKELSHISIFQQACKAWSGILKSKDALEEAVERQRDRANSSTSNQNATNKEAYGRKREAVVVSIPPSKTEEPAKTSA